MTIEVNCKLYYSVSGERFELDNQHPEQIEHAPAKLNIYTREVDARYELSVPLPIKKGRFFNSECYCAFVNEKEEILKIGDDTQFKIMMVRDGYDHERLHVKFETTEHEGAIGWVSKSEMEGAG